MPPEWKSLNKSNGKAFFFFNIFYLRYLFIYADFMLTVLCYQIPNGHEKSNGKTTDVTLHLIEAMSQWVGSIKKKSQNFSQRPNK